MRTKKNSSSEDRAVEHFRRWDSVSFMAIVVDGGRAAARTSTAHMRVYILSVLSGCCLCTLRVEGHKYRQCRQEDWHSIACKFRAASLFFLPSHLPSFLLLHGGLYDCTSSPVLTKAGKGPSLFMSTETRSTFPEVEYDSTHILIRQYSIILPN